VTRTIKLILEYDGTGLSGWQRQDNGPTVQEHLETALAEMIGKTPVVGASRTDAGVHALGQVASFRTEAEIPIHGFRRGLNGLLPKTIAVREASEVDESFHARFSARGKHYRYTVFTRTERSPLLRDRVWHRPRAIELERIRAAAVHLIGEHDFSAFRAAGCSAAHANRKVSAIEITATEETTFEIHVRGNAFLRNMVRIIAGTLVAVGEGRLEPDEVAEILASRDRTRAGQTAPAQGLTLMEVYYPTEITNDFPEPSKAM
jgi:tRNA pseudouridine38-40 synthase